MDDLDLPNGWIKSKLANVTEPRGEKALPSEYPDLPFLGMDHIEAQTARILGSVSAGSMKSSAARFYTGDVLYGRLRPYLNKVAQPAFDGLASAEFIVFPDTEVITSKFLKFRLNAADFVSFASHLNEGDRPRVNFEQIGEFEVLVPPIKEQHRIVAKIEALFSELDKGIENFKTAREQLKIYRQALLKHAFSGKLTEQWRAENADKLESAETLLRRIQTERQQRYQQQLKDWEANGKPGSKPKAPKTLPPLTAEELAVLPDLPEDWAWEKVGNICNSIVPNRDKPKTFTGNFEWITTPCLSDTSIKIDYSQANQGLSKEEVELYRAKVIPVNSVIMTCVGHFGLSAVVDKPIVINQQLHAFLSSGYLCPDFLAYCIQFNSSYFSKVSTSTTIEYINQENCNSMPIPLCLGQEQNAIVELIEEKLSVVDQLDQTIATALQQAEALRQSMLKKAFSGQLVPQDPNDEPASVLLERIRAEKAQADVQPARRRGKTA